MTRIVWNDYIEGQIRWADRLAKLAGNSDARTAPGFRTAASRAVENAAVALRLSTRDRRAGKRDDKDPITPRPGGV